MGAARVLTPNDYDELVVGRLQEFWDAAAPWQRSLWTIGTCTSIADVLEAAEGVSASALTEPGLKRLQAQTNRFAGLDPGVGDRQARQALTALLKSDLSAGHVDWHSLGLLLPRIREGYLSRLAVEVQSPGRPGYERIARYVASHLLEAGFASNYLHRWLRYRTEYRPDPFTLYDLLLEAESDLCERPFVQFEVILPVASAPGIAGYPAPPEQWRSGRELSSLIESANGTSSGIRHSGGFVISVRSRDPYSAVAAATEEIERWAGRAELATGKQLRPIGKAWIVGIPGTFSLASGRRNVEVGALDREHQIYTPSAGDPQSLRIDDALQLARPMADGTLASAIGGGWAAIEALLTSQGEDKALASDRLAAIIACSYPRAELTNVAYLHAQNSGDELSQKMNEADDNLARARLAADAIQSDVALAGRGLRDRASYLRMKELLDSPHETIPKVKDYVGSVLERLYRQRNLTLHGGLVSGEGRRLTLRTTPALVGAGLDRIAHAWFVERISPVQLAARAQLNISLLGSPVAPHPTAMLEPS